MMVAAKKKDDKEKDFRSTGYENPFLIPGIIEEFEVVDRPPWVSKRNKYHIDEHIKRLLQAVEEGKVVRVRANESVGKKLFLAFRNTLRSHDYIYRYRSLDDNAVLMWADKVKKTVPAKGTK
jgi:hypothetical protein